MPREEIHTQVAPPAPLPVSAPLRKPRMGGIGIALFSSAVFGVSGSFAKALLEAGWSPAAAVTLRMAGAALVLLLPTLLVMRGKWPLVASNWKSILLFGLFGVGACQFFYFLAVERLDVGVALLLEYLAPVLIVLFLWVKFRKRPKVMTIGGTLLSLAGLVLVLDLTGDTRVDPIGVLWGLGAAVGLTVYFFVSARADGALPPIVLATGGLLVGAVTMGLLALVGLLEMKMTFVPVRLAQWETQWWVALGGLILISTVISYVTGIMAARALGSKLASFISLTEVLFAVLWAWLLLGELPAGIQLLGGVLIVGGVLLVRADELRSP
ncbi:DMT family transporter [Paeniglutamicibacter psychrophenolicus]|uniref:Drug/metabolite transporter (DMT)-like permease n=1 Tax=Paeniglutamicibacter psychrophenolicus TaxID=257454 RepID=A0ABS4W9C5_9MICC|nr:drug/metabolite transporter (DMT)-like permease [Paeniglutamicibacter psychrophenolicus]